VFVGTAKFNTRAVLDVDEVHPGVGFPASGGGWFLLFWMWTRCTYPIAICDRVPAVCLRRACACLLHVANDLVICKNPDPRARMTTSLLFCFLATRYCVAGLCLRRTAHTFLILRNFLGGCADVIPFFIPPGHDRLGGRDPLRGLVDVGGEEKKF
jgi:hypothetical protein